MDANALRQAMAALPHPPTGSRPPHWDYWRCDLWSRAQFDNPVSFMSWPCVYHTMLVQHWSMATEFEYLLQSDHKRWPAVVMPHIGYPTDYFGETPYSANMINQAYHIALWETKTGKRIDQLDTIVEFGGGYGAMALLCWRLGFRGAYYIYDLPEFSLLQQWFLSQEQVTNVEWGAPTPGKVDLLTALYSLSEIPVQTRGRFLDQVKADSYLFLYSPSWESYDNLSYFQQVREKIKRNWFSQMTPRKVDWYLLC